MHKTINEDFNNNSLMITAHMHTHTQIYRNYNSCFTSKQLKKINSHYIQAHQVLLDVLIKTTAKNNINNYSVESMAGLEVNFKFHYQNTGQNENTKTANKYFEIVINGYYSHKSKPKS
jgi:hypothetical protein